MLTTRDLIVKWSFYGSAALLFLLVHLLVFGQAEAFGVRPFLPPLIVAVVASLEDTRSAMVFALAAGICCDLTVAAALPCLYTLGFTAASLLSSLLAKSVLQPGALRSVVVSWLAFLCVDALIVLTLSARDSAPLQPMLSLALREACVSTPFLLVCHPMMSFLHSRFTL